MSEIKIAYILSRFPAFTETFIIREVREIRRRGIGVEVFSLKYAKDREASHADTKELYRSTHYIPYFFSGEVWGAVYFFLRTQPGLTFKTLFSLIRYSFRSPMALLKSIAIFPKSLAIAKKLRDIGTNKIHTHWATIPATAAWIVSRLNGTEFTFTTHAWDIFKADSMLGEKLRAAAGVITISEFNKNYLLAKYKGIAPDKIKVIHIGIDLGRFKPHDRTRHDGEFVVLSIGRLVETKGFQFLLRACKLLRKKNLAFRCRVIYVSDAYEKEFFKLYEELGSKDSVELISEVPQERILDYYNSADCMAQPCIVDKHGDRDGIPTVIVEAMATDLPVISTPVSGIPEVIVNDVTGLMVGEGDAAGLADAIERLYNDRMLGSRLGKNGRELVEREFNISHNVDLLLEVILKTDSYRHYFPDGERTG